MIDKDDLRSFMRFLDEASEKELVERAQHYRAILDLLESGSEARRDYQFLMRRLRDEQVARLNVKLIEHQRQLNAG
jgi:hypothetical protein